jgi:octaprenyl-diphosphate synthase
MLFGTSSKFIKEELRKLDVVIRENLKSDVELVGEVGRYTIAAGGKRIRPLILIFAAKSSGRDPEGLYDLAAAIEFIHTATLLHDDVVDDSGSRRGKPTANVSFGNAAAVLVGDFLYSRAFQLMVRVGKGDIFPIMADATNSISEGEILQLSQIGKMNITEERYFEIIDAKTSRLFQAASQLGAVISERKPDEIRCFLNYGRHLGAAFQIIDDVLDYVGQKSELGKNLGDDLFEGKLTLPIIHCLRNATLDERRLIESAVSSSREDASALSQVTALIQRKGSIEYSKSLANLQVELALKSINFLPETVYKELLCDFARSAVMRDR